MTKCIDHVAVKRALRAMAENQVAGPCGVEAGALKNFTNVVLSSTEISPRGHANPQSKAASRGGRACARQALAEIGCPPVAIGFGTSGEPLWPVGYVGSISHTDSIAASVVALNPPMLGIGLDLERDEPVNDAAMVELICRPEELVAGTRPSEPVNLQRGKLLFVIKEAIYKLYWPIARTFLEFHDVNVMIDFSKRAFTANLDGQHLPSSASDRPITGRFTKVESLYVALASWLV